MANLKPFLFALLCALASGANAQSFLQTPSSVIVPAASSLQGGAGMASVISYAISGAEQFSTASNQKLLSQGLLTGSVASIYAPTTNYTGFITSIVLKNTSGSPVTGVSLYLGGTAAGNQIFGVNFAAGEQCTYTAGASWICIDNTGAALAGGGTTLTAGAGLSISSGVISLTVPVAQANGGTGQTSLSAVSLSALGAPTGAVPWGSQKITSLLDPTNPQEAATKAYVDSVAQGLAVKDSVDYATTTTLPTYVYNNGASGVGATITEVGNGALPTIDGVSPTTNDDFLVKNETSTNAPFNGIYVVTQVGTAVTPFILTRRNDADSPTDLADSFCFVESGTANANGGFVLPLNASAITVGTTNLNFIQFSGAGEITAGAGMTKTGNTLNVGQNADNSIIVNTDDVQRAAITGDVGIPLGSNTSALGNIPNATTAAGSIIHSNIAAPSTPASGKDAIYSDSTDLRIHDKNASGVIGTTVVADTGATNNFLTAISTAGAIGKAQPAFTNLSGAASCAQLPALTGSVTTSGCAATVVTNANLTGPVTSVGNATTIAAGAITPSMFANAPATSVFGNNGSIGTPSFQTSINLGGHATFLGLTNCCSGGPSGDFFYNNFNDGGVYPLSASGVTAQSWNFTGGGGEIDYWDTAPSATDSFRLYQLTGVGTANLLLDILPSGNANFLGIVKGTGLTATGLSVAGYVTNTSGGVLGTVSAIPTTGLSGALQAAQFPALTGVVITTAGSLATSYPAAIANSVLGNNTSGSATPAFQTSINVSGTVTDAGETVNGNVNIPSVSNGYQINGLGVLSTPTGTTNGAQIVVGTQAGLNLNASAIEATFVGQGAGGSGLNGGGVGGTGLTAAEDTCMGWHCFSQMTTGQFNTSLGVNTMGFETTGANNIAIGTDAMRNTIGMSNSIAIGVGSHKNGTASNNVSIGNSTLQGQTSSTGTNNTIVGWNAMSSTSWTTGANNNTLGAGALAACTSCGGNTAIGLNSGSTITGQTDNNFVGTNSGINNSGSQNSAFGSKSMGTGTGNGSNNTAIGYNAGAQLAGANANTIVGASVGSTTLASGTGNILIGTSSAIDTPLSSTNNYLNIGGAITGNLSTGAISTQFSTLPVTTGSAGQALVSSGVAGTTDTWATIPTSAQIAKVANGYYDAAADFGMVGDQRVVFDGACSTGANTKVTSATAAFVSGDLGHRITLAGGGASGAVLDATISNIDSGTQVTISGTTCATTVSAKGLQLGTSNATACASMVSVINSLSYGAAIIHFPLSSTNRWACPTKLIFTRPATLEGQGSATNQDAGDYSKVLGTALVWWGTDNDGGVAFDPFIAFQPVAPIASQNQSFPAPGIRHLSIDCRNGDQANCYAAVKLTDVVGFAIDDVFIMDPMVCFQMGTVDLTGVTAATGRGMMQNVGCRVLENTTAPVATAAATLTPTTIAAGSNNLVLTTSGQSISIAAANGIATPGYVVLMTDSGYRIPVKCTGGGGTTTLTGCVADADAATDSPKLVTGANIVQMTPNNGSCLLMGGTTNTNTNLFSLDMGRFSIGANWGMGCIEAHNADSISFRQVVVNGGNATNGGAINRIQHPGVVLSGSNATAANASRNITFWDGDAGTGGAESLALTSAGAKLSAPSGPNYWAMYQLGNNNQAPTIENGSSFEWTADGGCQVGLRSYDQTAAVAYTAGTAKTIPGTAFQLGLQCIQTGVTFHWRYQLQKTTAAGTTARLTNIRIGTTGTQADANVCQFSNATTAAIDNGIVNVYYSITTGGTTASATGVCSMMIESRQLTATAGGLISTLGTPVTVGTPTAFSAPSGAVWYGSLSQTTGTSEVSTTSFGASYVEKIGVQSPGP